MASFADSLVAPLSLVNALIVAVSIRNVDRVTQTFERLEKIWADYDVYAKSAALLSASEMPLLVYGTVSLSSSGEEQPTIIVNRIEKAENLPQCNYSTLFIRLASTDTDKISRVAEVLRGKGGSEQVRLAFSDTKSVSAINNVPNVNITKEIMEKLTKICGKSNIIVK